jgi:phage shock protein PspC (stress-responsive transcriptional regulator)
MNKTVNINLAGIFFHIDEDAYLKLQRYLEAIKRSFTDSQGRSEIISDIEARIAELFSERVKHNKQVIGIKEVDDVITIMGQPEDYLVDDEIFEDEPKPSFKPRSSTSKKLFRDGDNSYIAGVASGLGHYLGIDAIWIRLIWILLTIASGGTFILIYIIFWVLVPEAKTTAEKITMTGEPVNINNIEKKIKDGFETVTETVTDVAKNVSDSVSDAAKKVDFPKQGQRIKSSSKSFFDTLGEVIMFFLKIFAKFIGIILMIIGASALIGLIIALFSVSITDVIHIPGLDIVDIVNAGNTPIWLVSLLVLFTVGIPFFFLFYLGLKILINNLKSIGRIAKFTLLGLWLMSIIGLIVIGIRQASEHAFNERIIEKQALNIIPNDTIKIKMIGNDLYKSDIYRGHGFPKLAHDTSDNPIIYSDDVRLYVKSTPDSIATISIKKSADGRNYQKAIERAKNINYQFDLNNNTLLLDSYLTTNPDNKFSDQKVAITLYLPEGLVTQFSNNTKSFLIYNNQNGNIVTSKEVNHLIKILEDDIKCLDCPEDHDYEVEIDVHDDESEFKLNEKGLKIKDKDVNIEINNEGVSAESDDIEVKINSESTTIKSKNN